MITRTPPDDDRHELATLEQDASGRHDDPETFEQIDLVAALDDVESRDWVGDARRGRATGRVGAVSNRRAADTPVPSGGHDGRTDEPGDPLGADGEWTQPHPRMVERLEAVADEDLRRRNRRISLAAGLVLLALTALAASRSALLDVNEIEVVGAEALSPDLIRAMSGVTVGTPLLDVDRNDAAASLRSSYLLRDADVERAWSGTVTITVEERQAVAQYLLTDGVALVSSDGVVLDVVRQRGSAVDQADPDGPVATAGDPLVGTPALVADRNDELPVIGGAMFTTAPGEQLAPELLDALDVAASLPADLRPVIERVELRVDAVGLRLIGGSTVALGDARDLSVKFSSLRAIIDQVDLRCLGLIDVAAPTAPVVRRAATC